MPSPLLSPVTCVFPTWAAPYPIVTNAQSPPPTGPDLPQLGQSLAPCSQSPNTPVDLQAWAQDGSEPDSLANPFLPAQLPLARLGVVGKGGGKSPSPGGGLASLLWEGRSRPPRSSRICWGEGRAPRIQLPSPPSFLPCGGGSWETQQVVWGLSPHQGGVELLRQLEPQVPKDCDLGWTKGSVRRGSVGSRVFGCMGLC